MSNLIQITLPDELLDQLKQYARQRNQQLPEAIADYLRENPPPSAQTVTNLVHEPDTAVEREQAAFRSMHGNLLPDYLGALVAIHNGELVDSDTNKRKLMQRIGDRFPDKFVLIMPVQEDVEEVLHFRSPFLSRP